MAIALVVMLVVGLLMIGANILMAQWTWFQLQLLSLMEMPFVAGHFTLGVLASLFALFSVIITMFYFIGTAKAVKEGVRDHDLDRRYYEMTLKYKRKFFPVMTLSLVVYIALPCLGAAASVDAVSAGFHGLIGYLTFFTHAYITWKGYVYLMENDRLVARVHRLIREEEAKPGETQTSSAAANTET